MLIKRKRAATQAPVFANKLHTAMERNMRSKKKKKVEREPLLKKTEDEEGEPEQKKLTKEEKKTKKIRDKRIKKRKDMKKKTTLRGANSDESLRAKLLRTLTGPMQYETTKNGLRVPKLETRCFLDNLFESASFELVFSSYETFMKDVKNRPNDGCPGQEEFDAFYLFGISREKVEKGKLDYLVFRRAMMATNHFVTYVGKSKKFKKFLPLIKFYKTICDDLLTLQKQKKITARVFLLRFKKIMEHLLKNEEKDYDFLHKFGYDKGADFEEVVARYHEILEQESTKQQMKIAVATKKKVDKEDERYEKKVKKSKKKKNNNNEYEDGDGIGF